MEEEIFKLKRRTPVTKSASKVLGKCPYPECNGYVSLNADKTYYDCSNHLGQRKCKFHIRVSQFEKWGKPSIPAKMIERLLKGEVITCNTFLDTRNGTPLNHPTELRLEYIEAIKKIGINANIHWYEWV